MIYLALLLMTLYGFTGSMTPVYVVGGGYVAYRILQRGQKMNFTDTPEKTLCDRCDTVIIYTEHGPRLCQYHSRRHDTTFTGYSQKRFVKATDFLQ